MHEQKSTSNEELEQLVIDLETSILTKETALFCLTTKNTNNVILPTPSAQIFNNLDEYFKRSCPQKRHEPNQIDQLKKGLLSSKYDPPPERNFDRILLKPECDPRQVTSSSSSVVDNSKDAQQQKIIKRSKPDVLSKADKLHEASGPLYQLKKFLNTNVCVLVRRRRTVPFVSRVIQLDGKLIMFDAHFNILLHDVEESFKYSTPDGRLEKRGRLKKKLFVRGDNIILVCEGYKVHNSVTMDYI